MKSPMARRIHVFEQPDRFVADAVGVPGQRTFYLQARQADRLVSVVLEKVQVALLAERLSDMLKVVGRDDPDPAPDVAAGDDDAPLGQPLVEAFRVGTIALGWDVSRGKALIETRAVVEDDDAPEVDDDDPDGPDLLRVFVDAATVRAFARRAARVVAGGRVPCPMCGELLDPQGHLCPRRNGYVH